MGNFFKNGKHYRIERFGIMFVSLFLVLCVSVGVCLRADMTYGEEQKKSQVIYTTSFRTSRTGVTGKVDGIFKSTDGKSCMVLLKFDDITKVSIDAKNYQMFLTTADVKGNAKKMSYRPSGSIYMFGSTGYMGIYLYSTSGFAENEILELTMRCNAELVPVSSAGTVTEDASFAKYDQFQVYFNPAGTSIAKVECFDNMNFTMSDVYEELICRSQETAIREQLNADLAQMQADLNLIEEQESRFGITKVGGMEVVPPARPEYVGSDFIETDEDGSYIFVCEDVVPRGIDFDWFHGSVKEGYISGLVPEDMTYAKWIAQVNKEQGSFKNHSASNFVLSDGTPWLEYAAEDSDEGTNQKINTIISSLIQSYSTYFSHKQDYQTNHLKKLLTLELEAKNVETDHTINSNDDVLVLWSRYR